MLVMHRSRLAVAGPAVQQQHPTQAAAEQPLLWHMQHHNSVLYYSSSVGTEAQASLALPAVHVLLAAAAF